MDDFIYRVRPWVITLVLHNWPIMVYCLLIPPLALRAYLRPSRSALLALYGTSLLALGFEYQKHAPAVVRGTTSYLFEIHPEVRALSLLVLLDLLPAAVQLLGAAMIAVAVVRTIRFRRPSEAAFSDD